ncbi:MAG: sulfatase-like hydrolase/transferase [Sphingosinicella sp.]
MARLTLPATILVTLLFELALAERKYAFFGGGFGASQVLDTPGEIAAFLVGVLACQILLLILLYRLIRRLHGRKGDNPLFHFNFIVLAGGGMMGAAIGKYQALAYFSDAMSFQIVRNLGGGSLTDALLFSLNEIGLAAIGLVGAALFYFGALWLLRRRWRNAAPLLDHYRPSRRQWLGMLIATPLLLFAVDRIDGARSAVSRFNSVVTVAIVLHQTTDFDRDGWSLFTWPIDRAPFDSTLHPYALDVPGDGIDQDGFGGDFAFTGSAETGPPVAIPVDRRRHVVLIVLESTRADLIGMRVDGRAVAPNIEAMARSGSSAPAAYSHVGFTTQSLQSLFSGQLAPNDDRQSLIRDFLANGYRVGVLSGQAEDFGDTAALTGMRLGEFFVDATTNRDERAFSFAAQGSLAIDGRVQLREFDQRLGRAEQWERPTFLYINLQSAHFPYSWPDMPRTFGGEPIPRGSISPANRDWLIRTYWNAQAYNDALIGAVRARLRRLGVLDDTLIVVTADHGESLFDDGFLGHGHALNDQQTRIPFVVSDPGVAMPAALGLDDMRAIVLGQLGATAQRHRGPVFQYLGTLDRPGQIGWVGANGRRLLFNLNEELVWSSASQRWARYADLPPAGVERRTADALIQEWARQRWLRQLAGSSPP